jgi:formylmethanofuran dehydrogenase subunit E
MKKMNAKLSTERIEELFKILKGRFEKNQNRHKDLQWEKIQERLESEPNKLWSINEMERTGGEPDVVSYEPKTGEYVMTVLMKAPKDAEVFVTTARHLIQEKKTNRQTMPLIWRPPWV